MRSVLFMNVENMDPQPVSFFKGSATKVTRKFAVPLVHAASVLEVLVSVVLVGKNLAAALTLKALPGFCTAEGKVPPPVTPQQKRLISDLPPCQTWYPMENFRSPGR